jgi:hypothetical protein
LIEGLAGAEKISYGFTHVGICIGNAAPQQSLAIAVKLRHMTPVRIPGGVILLHCCVKKLAG